MFTLLTLVLISTAFVGKSLALNETWTVIFAAGAALALTYLVLAVLALPETIRRRLLDTNSRNRMVTLGAVYGPILAALAFWIVQAGTVEALPIFPAFLVIFHAWILLQAYFIASPVTQALTKVEDYLASGGLAKRIVRTLGLATLFLPTVPLVFGVWLVSNWLNGFYQGVQDVSGTILVWTIGMVAAILVTYFLVFSWTWPVVRRGRPQAAVFTGGTFTLVWGYLLYRATSMIIAFLNQRQPEFALLDIGLMVLSILAAMQTFAGKIISRADRRWFHVFPFLVFAFGSIYAVAQLYFLIQIPVTRVDLSIFINATVFASGIVIMLLFIRRHVLGIRTTPTSNGSPAN